jgi:hypothetical protein
MVRVQLSVLCFALIVGACSESKHQPRHKNLKEHCVALGETAVRIEHELSGPRRELALELARALRPSECVPEDLPSLTSCGVTGDPECVFKRIEVMRAGYLSADAPYVPAASELDLENYCGPARIASMESAGIQAFDDDGAGWAAQFAGFDMEACGFPGNAKRVDCYFRRDLACIRSTAGALAAAFSNE